MADPMDDLRAMGEAVDRMDSAPEPEPAHESRQEQDYDPEPAEESRYVGGIDDPVDDGEGRRTTLDDIFAPVAKPVRGGERQAQEHAPEDEGPSSGRDQRIKELTDQLAEEREMRNKLTEAMLQGRMPEHGSGRPSGDAEPASLPDLDQDVIEWLRPYAKSLYEQEFGERLSRIDELESAIQPLRKTQQDQVLVESIGRHVNGFKPEHLDVLAEAYNGLNDEDKAFYGETVQGAALLARELVEQGKLKIGSRGSRGGSNSLSSRHTPDIAGQMPQVGSVDDEAETVQRIQNLSSDQVRDLLDQMRE